jgi:hypothetical protein
MVDPAVFAAALQAWHDFFLATAGASAALLGLLFVGVSISLNAIGLAERADLRATAEQVFANLLYVLAISLILLVPNSDATGDSIALGAIAVVGTGRVIRNITTLRENANVALSRATLRRLGWTIAADLLLAYVAVRFWVAPDPKEMVFVMAATLVLMLGAADTAWEMLVEVSHEGAPRPG